MNKQNKIIVGVVALILALTVGYAVFSQSLNISGTAKASGSLDIVFREVGEIVYQGANETTTTEITENGKKLVIEGTELNYPTAYVDVPVAIVNNGTVDGILESITVENLETDDIKVSIKGVEKDQVVKVYNSNDDTTIVNAIVRIEWLDKTDTKAESTKQIVVRLNARQLLKSDVTTTKSGSVANNCTAFTKKDTYSVGDVISFCNENTGKSEDFYVISDNGETVTALAKYNLLVGNSLNTETFDTTPIPTDTKDYGLQSEITKYEVTDDGMPVSSAIIYGSITFADKDENKKNSDGYYLGYWTDSSGNLLSKYGSDYPTNVLNENSLLYVPLNNYSKYFAETLNKKSSNIDILSYDDMINLGCSSYGSDDINDCSGAQKFIVNDSFFWTKTAASSRTVWLVGGNSLFSHSDIASFQVSHLMGIRPVITISKSEI